MAALALACLIAAAAPPAIGLATIELDAVSDEDARAVVAALAEEIQRASRRPVITVVAADCAPACLDAVRASARTDDVILLRLFAGPHHVHAVAERHATIGGPPIRATQDLPNQADHRRFALAGVAKALFPEAPALVAEAAIDPLATAAAAPPARSALPWIPAALAVAAAGAGTILGVMSVDAHAKLARPAVLDDEPYRALRGDASATQAASIVLLTSAAALAGVSAWLSVAAE